MDTQYSSTDNRAAQLAELEQEILQLEQKMQVEMAATILHDMRLRLCFVKWKKELLSIAFGK